MSTVHLARPADHSDRRQVAAIHEAGHAVVALACGVGVAYVTILPDTSSYGRAKLRPDNQSREQYIIAIMAGEASQRRFCPGSNARQGAAGDNANARRFADLVCTSPRAAEALVRYAAAEAEGLVREREHAIVAVAAALLARTFLTGEEVTAVIAAADEHHRADLAAAREVIAATPDAGLHDDATLEPRPRRCRHGDLQQAAWRVIVQAAAERRDLAAAELRTRVVEELSARCDPDDVARTFDRRVAWWRREEMPPPPPSGSFLGAGHRGCAPRPISRVFRDFIFRLPFPNRGEAK